MQNKCAIVLVIDRLRTAYLGPYGNTWIDTPAFNRLAADGLLFDNHFAETSDLEEHYRAIWSQLRPWLADGGPPATLISDDANVIQLAGSTGFRELLLIPASCEVAQPAPSIEETQLGTVFATVCERIERAQRPFLLWVHATGMSGAWDAPYELREQWADVEDPAPPHFVTPPDYRLAMDCDPDELLGLSHAYAGQISLLDNCLGSLMTALQDRFAAADQPLLIVTSPRGYPLGEQGRVGPCGDTVREETIHLPLIIHDPDGVHSFERMNSLSSPCQLLATLFDWFRPAGAAPFDDSLLQMLPDTFRRPYILCRSNDRIGIRTPSWLFTRSISDPASRALFHKPDDRWEINEIANRGVDVADELDNVLNAHAQAGFKTTAGDYIPLSRVAMEGMQ